MKKGFWAKAENGTAEVYLFEDIGYWGVMASDIVAALRNAGPYSEIVLHVNSPGGDVFEGLAIYNVLKGDAARVRVVVEGLAASAASVVAMAGDRVEMGLGAFLMIHNTSGFVYGGAQDMEELGGVLRKLDSELAGIYAARGRESRDHFAGLMAAETWLTGTEAVALGLADVAEAGAGAQAEAVFESVFGLERAPEGARAWFRGEAKKGLVARLQERPLGSLKSWVRASGGGAGDDHTERSPSMKFELKDGRSLTLAEVVALLSKGERVELKDGSVLRPEDVGIMTVRGGGQGGAGNQDVEPEPVSADVVAAVERGIAAEFSRQSAIRALGREAGVAESEVEAAVTERLSVEAARAKFWASFTASNRPVTRDVQVVRDQMQTILDAAPDALRLRAMRSVEKPHEAAGELARLSPVDLCRRAMAESGQFGSIGSVLAMSPKEVFRAMIGSPFKADYSGGQIRAAANAGTMTTAMFPKILSDALYLELAGGYELPEATWNQVAIEDTLPDLRAKELPRWSEPPRLVNAKEGEETTFFRFTDQGESYQIAKYKAGLAYTEEDFINDRLGAFLEQVNEFGMSVAAQIDDAFWAYWLANGNLSDGSPFFDSSRGNYYEGASTALDDTYQVTALAAARKNFRMQYGKQAKGKRAGAEGARRLINAVPTMIITGPTLGDRARNLVLSPTQPGQTNSAAPNVAKGTVMSVLEVPQLEHPDLTGYSATAWYLAARRELAYARVGFLNGQRTPEATSNVDWNHDAIQFKVKHWWGVLMSKPEYVQKQKGAA